MNLPNKIRILEVGPRDGFQNLKTFIETKHKIEIIDALAGAGLQSIEATSFVNPKWVPQMADAKEVCAYCAQRVDKTYELAVLVPNGKGVENALAAGAEKITMVISVSEAHNKANVNRTVEESFQEFEKIVKTYPNGRFRLALATVFGCPFGEEIRTERVTELLKRAKDTG
ncbi:MAG: hydroxymethylglutaryl-CoA lyase, partial [Fusobacteriaceae bacterium]|nr:hydroxymethylglutaryl-CoA lyase [Fusobacteriaceae bacterium]